MYSFNWSELVTDSLCTLIKDITGYNTDINKDIITNLLAVIFKSVGGFPVTKNKLDENERTILAKKILSEALDRYFYLLGLVNISSGYYVKESDSSYLEYEIIGEKHININRAEFDELESLPIIGNKIAAEIIKERTENGYFDSFIDLTNRIKGLGEKSVKILNHILLFNKPNENICSQFEFENSFESKLKTAILFYTKDPDKNLYSFLDNLASTLTKKPHPKSLDLQIREELKYELIETSLAEWISVLDGSEYYKSVPDIIKSANKSVKVAMFHIAYPKTDHPTKTLLDQLIEAQKKGVEVKVVLDKDREHDPYKSKVINQNAKEYLKKNGVECKFDKEDILLHSKYIIVDDKYIVIGSHNWSAGSYFQFDDLSFVICSPEISVQLSERFDKLWKD